ncbi:MAG TPA: hypothetical protein VG405_06165 [Solirubrobacteraceae bacterium]|jgi:hypothetical protein|nr:hypothetical protein [Solirubrobacteraceae bacterium]
MNAISYGPAGDTWQEPEDDLGGQLPVRPRRRLLTRSSALLLALVTAAIGFYIGIRVEKGQVSSSSTGGGGLASLASRFAAARGGSGSTGARSSSAGTGSLGGFAGGGFPGGGGVSGTVANVNGKTIYVTETGGNTVRVRLSSATKLTKSVSVNRSKIDPGDRVLVSGVTGSRGAVSATSLTDSGSGSSSAATSSSSGGTSSSSGSAVSSLFGG